MLSVQHLRLINLKDARHRVCGVKSFRIATGYSGIKWSVSQHQSTCLRERRRRGMGEVKRFRYARSMRSTEPPLS